MRWIAVVQSSRCPSQLRLELLSLGTNPLGGSLPAGLGDLRALEDLSLRDTGIAGLPDLAALSRSGAPSEIPL